MRRAVTVIGVAALVVGVAVAAVWTFQRKLIYLPSQSVPSVDAIFPAAEEVTFHTEDGLTLAAWFVPATGTPTDVTVLVFNGNGGNRADRSELARELSDRGYQVLLFDYRGYGGNPGKPSEDGLVADGRAAVEYLLSRDDVDPRSLVYFGESLGAAVAIGVADERPPSILILRSPFSSLAEIASVHYPFLPASLLLWDEYPNVETIRGIDVPTLVVAGSGDRTIPSDQSEMVYRAASGPRRFVLIEGADHNDTALSSGSGLIDEVAAFIDEQSS